jgi:hypothetical protein
VPHPLIIAGIALAILSALLMGNAESKMEKKSNIKVAEAATINKVK